MSQHRAPILIAFKVVGLHPDLATSHRRVAGALLDSFNHKTGQCDPGLDRIARLLGVHRRTAIRAIRKLEEEGLFRKVRHGGYSHRNRYEPQWPRFLELEARWKNRFEGDALARRIKLSPLPGQTCHSESDRHATQTCRTNQSNLTSEEKRRSESPCGKVASTSLPPRPPSSTSSHAASRIAAERRWYSDLLNRYCGMPDRLNDLINGIDDVLSAAATTAEMKQRGTGLTIILQKLGGASLNDGRYLEAALRLRSDEQ
jgi:hypothetical protein